MTIVETLFTGRPEEHRTAREERCYDLLDSLSVEYYRVDHEHAGTIQDCELVEGLLGCRIDQDSLQADRDRPSELRYAGANGALSGHPSGIRQCSRSDE